MSEWREIPLGELVSLQRGHDLPTTQRQDGDVPVMGSFGVTGRHSKARANGPGVTVGRSGASIGVVSYVAEDYWPLNTCLFATDFHGNNPRFIYYFLKTLNLARLNSGSAQPSLNRNYIAPIQVRVPTRLEQDHIANLLAPLDDKVELNRRMNETLEAMARAIFRDWFVDFGPTRAKQEVGSDGAAIGKANSTGHAPYLAPDLWALFPDKLDDDGKPEGWETGFVSDIAEAPRRGIRPSDVDTDTPYIGLEHMPRHSVALSEWENAGKVTSNKSTFQKGELLFGKLRPYFHKVGIAPLNGICSTDIVVVRPKDSLCSAFVLTCLSSDDFVDYTDRTSTGTKMPRTSWKIMGNYPLCLPPEPVAQAFENVVQPLTQRIVANIHENNSLAATRDLLLPKLMSGEIRVAEAENAVDTVA